MQKLIHSKLLSSFHIILLSGLLACESKIGGGADLYIAASETKVKKHRIDDIVFDEPSVTTLSTAFGYANSQPWPGGILDIRFEAGIPEIDRQQFMSACNDWANTANITCRMWSGQARHLYVTSQAGGCWAEFGASLEEKPKQLNLDEWCWDKSLILHELGHALGFAHEHQRSDRDQFVNIIWKNVHPLSLSAFDTMATENFAPYDFDSIMHYVSWTFGIPWNTPPEDYLVIVKKPQFAVNGDNLIRPTDKLSRLDRTKARMVYGPRKKNPSPADFDGDGRSDFAVFRPNSGVWFVIDSTTDRDRPQQWGLSGDIPLSGDFDGDGKTDFAVFRPGESNWYILPTSTGVSYVKQWGLSGDIPVVGDFDGDQVTDVAVFRPSEGNWYITNSLAGAESVQQWGLSGDIPLSGDFDGDGKTDFAVFRPGESNWYIIPSSTSVPYVKQWGLPGDIPLVGDFDGDHVSDFAVFRPVEGNWYITPSTTKNAYRKQFGLNGDIPISGDFNGDGKSDFAVYRPSTSVWHVSIPTTEEYRVRQWGLANDIPLGAPQ